VAKQKYAPGGVHRFGQVSEHLVQRIVRSEYLGDQR